MSFYTFYLLCCLFKGIIIVDNTLTLMRQNKKIISVVILFIFLSLIILCGQIRHRHILMRQKDQNRLEDEIQVPPCAGLPLSDWMCNLFGFM